MLPPVIYLASGDSQPDVGPAPVIQMLLPTSAAVNVALVTRRVLLDADIVASKIVLLSPVADTTMVGLEEAAAGRKGSINWVSTVTFRKMKRTECELMKRAQPIRLARRWEGTLRLYQKGGGQRRSAYDPCKDGP